MSSSRTPYVCAGALSGYSTAFPPIPRAGTAVVTIGAAAPASAERTLVRFVAREKSASPPTDAAAKDAERETCAVSYEAGARVLTLSLGPSAKVDAGALRKSAIAAVTKLRALKVTTAEVQLPTCEGIPAAAVASTIVQATVLSSYAFDRYITLEDKAASLISALHFLPAGVTPEEAHAARVASTLAECTIFARDLVNERADEMHPSRLEAVARTIAAESGAAVHVLEGSALLSEGLHLLHAVGQAARHAPRYIELMHKGDPSNPRDVMLLVGKGITFDSGGLNIKPTGSMEEMHMDMGGAAAVLGAFRACTALGLKRNLVAVIAVAENAIDAHSFKPHNILRSHRGLTVEIKNTDAEGRLVLADALSYAQMRHSPHTIIDLATLTGACIVALGEYAAGLFTNNASLTDALLVASRARHERLWAMPIFPEHEEEIKGTAFADLQSTGAGRYGGSCTAAAFLKNFIGPVPSASTEGSASPAVSAPTAAMPAWAHIDLAGPAMYSKARGFMNAGGTGFGVSVLFEYLSTAPAGGHPADVVRKY